MGYCCSQEGRTEEGNLATSLHSHSATLGGRQYTVKDIMIIVRIQAGIRMFLAKRKVNRIRTAIYGGPSMGAHMDGRDQEAFDNIDVQVSQTITSARYAKLLCPHQTAESCSPLGLN